MKDESGKPFWRTHTWLAVLLICGGGVSLLWLLVRGRWPSCRFLDGVPQFLLASINSLITTSQANYLNRLDDILHAKRVKPEHATRTLRVWTLLLAAFFTLTATALLSVFRIILWASHQGDPAWVGNPCWDSTVSTVDKFIIAGTGWGYFLLALVAFLSWVWPSSAKKLPNRGVEPVPTKADESPYYKLIGMRTKDLSADGRASVSVQITREHLNLYGQVHGGVALSLADAAGGAALGPMLGENEKLASRELTMHFIAPVEIGELLMARAKVDTHTTYYATTEVTVREGDKVVARATVKYDILRPTPA